MKTSLPILTLTDLAIMRGDITLCSGVCLSLGTGEICHLIGQNGLGKTTLLMQLAGILPTAVGQIDCLGNNTAKGALYIPHQTGLSETLSVAQNLAFLTALYGKVCSYDELERALAQVGLAGFGEMPSTKLSAGQSRRVGLARLWLFTPSDTPLLLLDEPFTALDVQMVDKLCQRLAELAKQGAAVLMTSHQPVACATKTLDLSVFFDKGADDE